MEEKIKIGACIMVHNMAPFMRACIESLQWVDGIFVYDDHSTDKSLQIAINQSKVPLKYETSKGKDLAFKSGEMKVRNYIIKRAFEELNVDVMVIADADELFSSSLKEEIINSFGDPKVKSAVFSTWHLYDNKRYIHFWESKFGEVTFVDPHTRIIRRGKLFTPLFKDGSHPIIKTDKNTTYLDGLYHFHLKYHKNSKLPNYSLNFLPKFIKENDVKDFLRNLPSSLPKNVFESLKLVNWKGLLKHEETPHYNVKRIKFSNSGQELIHPKYFFEKKIERGKDILLFYEKQKWDYVKSYSKRSVSGFYAWYVLLVKSLKKEGYRVHENDYELARANPNYPVGIVGTPQLIEKWDLENPAIIGPSMYDNPLQNINLMKDKRFKYYILTCNWLKDIFEKRYGNKCILWFGGIPLDEWEDTRNEKKDIDLLIYNKIRWGKKSISNIFLPKIKEHLNSLGLRYCELRYGNITHKRYRSLLKKSKAMLFLCEHETQGIAYQEALASNVPVIAWDHGWWTDPVWQGYLRNPMKATSVPIFSKECGEKFKMIEEFPLVFNKFWQNLEKYSPRDYLSKKYSQSKSAKLYTKYYFKI